MKHLLFGTLITLFVFGLFIGCENASNPVTAEDEYVAAAARKLDGSQIVYPLVRTITKYNKPMYDAFENGNEHRLAILALQMPNEPKGHIWVRVSVIPSNPGVNTIYSNRPVRVGYPGHVHISNYQLRMPPSHLKRNTDDCYIHYTDNYGVFTFNAHSRIGENAYIDLDVGGRTYKVALIDS